MSFHTRTKKIISWSRWFHKLEFKSSVLCFEHNTNISLNRSDKRKASKEFLNCFHHKYKVNLEHKADFSLFVICDMFFLKWWITGLSSLMLSRSFLKRNNDPHVKYLNCNQIIVCVYKFPGIQIKLALKIWHHLSH